MSDQIDLFINKLRTEPAVQHKVRGCCTAAELAAVAEDEGFNISGADLIKYFAQQLLSSDDERTSRNFDILSWDVGELLWILKSWEF